MISHPSIYPPPSVPVVRCFSPFLRCTSGFVIPTFSITRYSHPSLLSDHFPVGLFSITVLIIGPSFSRLFCNRISFVTRGRWKRSRCSRLCLNFHFTVWASLRGAKILLRIFRLKTSNHIFPTFLKGCVSGRITLLPRVDVTCVSEHLNFQLYILNLAVFPNHSSSCITVL